MNNNNIINNKPINTGVEQRRSRRHEREPEDSWDENASHGSHWALCIQGGKSLLSS